MPEQPAERINPYFVVDTGFVAPSRGNVCYEFQRSGRCIKGAACRFTHGDDISNAGVTPGVGQAGAVAPRADAKPWLSNAVSVVRGADGSIQLAAAPAYTLDVGHQRDKKSSHKHSEKHSKHSKHSKHKHEHEHKKKHKHKKRSRSRSRGGSSDSDKGGSEDREDDSPPRPDVVVQPLSSDDYFLRNIEFSSWLRSTTGQFFTELTSQEARQQFEHFVARWNARQLPARYYVEGGITASGRR